VLTVQTTAWDDQQERGLRLLLLGRGTVFVHRFERLLTAETDEEEQRGARTVVAQSRCRIEARRAVPTVLRRACAF
jgi:hypothetical protein